MPKPRSTMPRGYLKHPELFGRHGKVDWLQPSSPDEYAGLRAAELQHHFVLDMTDRLDDLQQTKSWLEERSGIAAGRLSKLLRGHAQLTLRDVAALEGVLGPVLSELDFARQAVRDPRLRARFSGER